MYESYFGLDEKPFSLLPDPSYLYFTAGHANALAALEYGLKSSCGFTVITGEVGSGKTTLIRYVLDNLDEDITVGLITNTHPSFGDLLQWVLLAFGVDCSVDTKHGCYKAFVEFVITEYSHGRRSVLVVDEAQNMTPAMLEELRLLSNVNSDKHEVFQLVLIGQPGLRNTLSSNALRQFAQRISTDYHLDVLRSGEIESYVQHRVASAGGPVQLFATDSFDIIYRYSAGVPRLINVLCDTALAYAFGAQAEQVSASTIREVVRDRAKNALTQLRVKSSTQFRSHAVAGVESIDEKRKVHGVFALDSD